MKLDKSNKANVLLLEEPIFKSFKYLLESGLCAVKKKKSFFVSFHLILLLTTKHLINELIKRVSKYGLHKLQF